MTTERKKKMSEKKYNAICRFWANDWDDDAHDLDDLNIFCESDDVDKIKEAIKEFLHAQLGEDYGTKSAEDWEVVVMYVKSGWGTGEYESHHVANSW